MTIVVPNTASTLAASGCIVGSKNCWAWVGFQTLTASGSVTWYSSNSPTSGCELLAISLVAQQSAIFGPFNAPNGLYSNSPNGGCAVVWLKIPAGT